MLIVLAIYVTLLVFCLWGLVCNRKCYKQQIALINEIFEANKASGYNQSYWYLTEAVSYHQHLWRLMTFRDPWAIYPPELAEVQAASK